MKTKVLSLIISLISLSIFAQTNLNKYKYVIVPNKYDFLKERDQYQLNSLSEFLFNKYGFEAIMEGSNYPDDLAQNRCLALKSNALKESSLFKTKLSIELKDCNDVVVYTGKPGESREKEFKKAYHDALRAAFTSVAALNHKYDALMANKQVATVASNGNTEIEQLKAEIKNLKEEKAAEATTVAVATIPMPTPATKTVEQQQIGNTGTLYAQPLGDDGYQLIDSTPKVVFKIKKTGQTDLFLVEGSNGIIYKKDNVWIHERNTDSGVAKQELNIKF